MVLKGESGPYLGPAVPHLITIYCGWGLWPASRQFLVTALFFEVSTEPIHSVREAENYYMQTSQRSVFQSTDITSV